MTDTLRDQLLGLGFKAAPKPEQARRSKPGRPGARAGDTSTGQKAAGGGKADGRPNDRSNHRSNDRPQDRTRDRAKGNSKAGTRADIDLAKAYAIRASREKAERLEAERLKQEEARLRREARSALATLVEGKALNDPAADIARHFDYGGKIKRVHVTEAQLKALNAGELGVVQVNGRYVLVTSEVLAEAERVFAPAVALRVDPTAPAADDPYADPRYQVPDDLVW